ncbi:MAG: AAA family ATPase [Promethearchaeota archaeon]
MKVIGFCGLPGSGKSTAIEAIAELGKIITMGDVIRDEAKNRNIEPSGKNLGKIAKELRKKGGSAIIAKKCIELIKNLDDEIIIVDGIRSFYEVNEFRREWKFPLIAIELNDQERIKRLYDRARSDDSKTINEIKQRDQREIGFGLKEVVNKANYKIQNDSTVEELKKKTRNIVLEILQTY